MAVNVSKALGRVFADLSGNQEQSVATPPAAIPFYDCFYALFTNDKAEFTNAHILPSQASRIASAAFINKVKDGVITYNGKSWKLDLSTFKPDKVYGALNSLIAANPLSQILGRTSTYAYFLNWAAENFGHYAGDGKLYNPLDVLQGLNKAYDTLPPLKGTGGVTELWQVYDQVYDYFKAAHDTKVQYAWLYTLGEITGAIVAVFLGVELFAAVAPGAAAATGKVLASVGTSLYDAATSAIMDTLGSLKKDLLDKLTDPQTYADVFTQIVKDNVSNKLQGIRQDINSFIQEASQKSGVDLEAVNTLVGGITGKLVKDVTDSITKATSDMLQTIIQENTTVTTSLSDALKYEQEQNINNSQAIGDGFYNALAKLFYSQEVS